MIFGNRRSRPTNWLKAGLDHARRVGRIESIGGQAGLGTGFLLDGEMFDDRFRHLPFFLTCNHVVRAPGDSSSEWAITHENARVVFEGMFDDTSPNVSSRFEQVLSSSPTDRFNYTLLLLQRWPGSVTDIAMAPKLPEPTEPVIVLGYPAGGGLAVALEDNEALGSQGDSLYYRAPTEGGSSGSLVLNQYWEAVALHTGGDREHQRNYGTALAAILAHARSLLPLVQIPPETAARIGASKVAHRGRRETAPDDTSTEEADFFSAFISYSHEDSAFALRLYNALQSHGVRTWLDKHEMFPGDDIYDQVHKGIRRWDKLLLCCSKSSLSSWWVDNEIDEAFQKERELFKTRGEKVLALIPLDLDGFLFDQWPSGKAQQVRSRLAADFRGWTTAPSGFDDAFERLLKALRADAGARPAPPKPKL